MHHQIVKQILRVAFLFLGILILLPGIKTPCADEEFMVAYKEAIAKNPEGVTLQIRLADGKKQFHMGEIIRLELAFSSSKPDTYQVEIRKYDRIGRLFEERYLVSPAENAVDPVQNYFWGPPFFGGICGGLSGLPRVLDATPWSIEFEINEWIRFEKPGTFQIYVISDRVWNQNDKGRNGHTITKLPVTSNIIEFEILPFDREWAEKTLQEAVQKNSARVLRFLDTEQAAEEMIKRLKGTDPFSGDDFQYYIGLIGSSHREYIVKTMEKYLVSPDHPVSEKFLRALSLCAYYLQLDEPMPVMGSDQEENSKVFMAYHDRQRKRFQDIETKYLEQLIEAIPKKTDTAKAISLAGVVELTWNDEAAKRDSAPVAEYRKKLPVDLAPVFHCLPQRTKQTLLDIRWKYIKHPAMYPVVRKIAEGPPDPQHRVTETAVQRLQEIDDEKK
ncbi:MAG TPA: hypothetical protein PLQ35_14505 [bacterium]|nr:hypothetical protein [bacterium]HQL63496.1 hypothetical protein [bacterium]